MLTAEEVNDILINKKLSKDKEKADYEREYAYIDKDGEKRYYSSETIESIEQQILDTVNGLWDYTYKEFAGKLKPEIVKTLKENGYRVFLQRWVKRELMPKFPRGYEAVQQTYINSYVVWGCLPEFLKDSEVDEL